MTALNAQPILPLLQTGAPNQVVTQPTLAGMTITPIPPEIAALGAFQKVQPPSFHRCRGVIWSESKGGKSNVLCSFPRTAVIDCRGGCHSALSIRAHVIPVGADYAKYRKAIDTLIAMRKTGRCPYDTVAIDVANEWQDMLEAELIRQHNSKIQNVKEHARCLSDLGMNGWTLLKNLATKDLNDLYNAGFGWWVSVHLFPKKAKVGGDMVSTLEPAVKGGILDFLLSEPELQLTVVKFTKQEDRMTIVKKPVEGVMMDFPEPVIGPDGLPIVDTKVVFYIDAQQSLNAKINGSRVPFKARLSYPAWTPQNPITGYDVIKTEYDKVCKELIATAT